MSKLSPDAQELIRAAQLDSPPPGAKERLRAELANKLNEFPENPSPEASANTSPAIKSLLLKVLGTSLLGVLGFGLVIFLADDSEVATQPKPSPALKVAAPAKPPIQRPRITIVQKPAPAPKTKPSNALAGPRIKNAKPRSSSKRPVPTPKVVQMPKKDSQLVQELRLISSAESEVRNRRFETALSKLEEHENKFFSGKLQNERELLRVLIYCSQVKRSKAREVARTLLKRAKQATVRDKIADTCARDVINGAN